ncbi:hypothetical protein NCCP2140_31600 [Pseudoalteromonas sp. NCCP-2140]|uniref:hypothetical protein n=1 Tax=Pseudoalteromonas sp. NCCP-2140 TaxID=2942288 RepID=UPI00203EC66F|nr:hypothetical protein [Pseudoalteromonas sp. NCCP-2140]GKW54107.1 hypothetical protein NCCP2140_31600 [Pseudoalteromonas sp. NCCP-2140]
MKAILATSISILTLLISAQAQEPKIEAFKAPFHVGKSVMACGEVAQVSKGKKATYLNLDKEYPNQSLTILVWDSNLAPFEERFGNLKRLSGERICARGKISEYKNTLQIKVSNPQFLRLMK